VYASAISDEVVAAYIEVDQRITEKLKADWRSGTFGIPLVVIPSPYRSVLRPLVEYVENLRMVMPGELVTVVVPEIVPKKWWEHLLHNKTAFYIRTAFLFKPNVVVTTVPFLLGHAYRLRDLIEQDDQIGEEVPEGLEHGLCGAVGRKCFRAGRGGVMRLRSDSCPGYHRVWDRIAREAVGARD